MGFPPKRLSASSGFFGAAAALALACGACTGNIEAPDDPNGAQVGPVAGTGGTPTSSGTAGSVSADFAPAGARLRRLTRSQYASSVKRLLGEGVTLPGDLEEDPAIAGYLSVAASTLGVSERRVEQLESAALALSQQAVASSPARQKLVPCAVGAAVDAPCLEHFVTTFGRRALRRPLTQVERDRYLVLAKQVGASDPWLGVQAVVLAVLQSPLFLYRREFGAVVAGDSQGRVLDGYELASRLSFFLEDTSPDDALLESAAAGKLDTDDGLKVEAERLLALPAARTSLKGFAAETLHLANLAALPQIAGFFPLLTSTLGESMRSEALLSFENVAFEGEHDFRDLLDTRQTYVNGELARLYGLSGVPDGAAFLQVTLPDDGRRLGLLGQAAFLAGSSHASSASATRRGQFIREALLCQAIPPPPPTVSTTLPDDSVETGHRTARQKLELHRRDATCAACHAQMDPIGLGLENFDALGSWRDDDGGLAIDASSELDSTPFKSLKELAHLLRERPEVTACVTRNVFRFALGHQETPGEAPYLADLTASFEANGHRFRALLLALTTHPAFRRAGEPE